tara:strand:+ start:373 stop:513 length:141 start_codon:yes stop_codon:yes gene_type:complete
MYVNSVVAIIKLPNININTCCVVVRWNIIVDYDIFMDGNSRILGWK